MQKNNNLHSFDDIMDAQFGAPGTPEREQFNHESEAYCVGQLISNNSKLSDKIL